MHDNAAFNSRTDPEKETKNNNNNNKKVEKTVTSELLQQLESKFVTTFNDMQVTNTNQIGGNAEQLLRRALTRLLPEPVMVGKWQITSLPKKTEGDIVICKGGKKVRKTDLQLFGVDPTQVYCVIEVKATLTKQLTEKASEELKPLKSAGLPSILIAYRAGNISRQAKGSKQSTILGWLNVLPRGCKHVLLFPKEGKLSSKGRVFKRNSKSGWKLVASTGSESSDGFILLYLLRFYSKPFIRKALKKLLG